jgi:hypothetical protein
LSYLKTVIDAALAAMSDDYFLRYVLVNATVNSFDNPPSAAWEGDLAYIVDAFHVKFPRARVYISKPWKRGYDADANTFANSVDAVLATRGAWASVGHDERVWLKGADDGATMTYDGVHYTTAGNTECAAQWKTILGY